MSVEMFIKLPDIPGESTDSKHKGEIEVLSFSWGVSQAAGSGSGGGGGAGKPQVTDFSFVKQIGAASPALFVSVCKGDHMDEAVFTANTGTSTDPKGKKGQPTFYKVTFSDVLISGVRAGGQSGNDLPLEEVSLNFAKVEIEYFDGKSSKATSCDFVKLE
jgi:type VI secretion system secreted protein Hcp